jgi:hypothetical protein
MGRTKLGKNNKPLLRQILDLIPDNILRESIHRYQTDKYCSKYKTYDQLVAMIFGQLDKCLTLKDFVLGFRNIVKTISNLPVITITSLQ